MQRNSQRVSWENSRGLRLAGIWEMPPTGQARGSALFSHCFTCTKDLKAIVRISRRLAELGWAVLRYDFTGLGDSGGDFSQTTFADNVQDLRTAAQFLTESGQPPQLLIGHSLGGAASVVAAPHLPSLRGVVNLAAPATTHHLAQFLARQNPAIEADGAGEVVIGGRAHLIRRPMLEALRGHDHAAALQALQLPLLVLFSPADETLPFHHGLEIFRTAGGPTSFINLQQADHLLVNNPADVTFVANCIDVWASRYVLLSGA